jgi:uncharacterized iron-regulated membrane protein
MWYSYIISFLLHWVALSCYWKRGEDMKWYNWFLHGFFIGLALIPFVFCGISWFLILGRAILLGTTMSIWSELNDNAVWEEFGRGFLIISTLGVFYVKI